MLPSLINNLILLALLALGPAGQLGMERRTLQDVLDATGGRPAGVPAGETVFSKVSIDSRTTEPGVLFWALCGPRHDGHDYVGEAMRRGAVACVVDDPRALPTDVPAIAVPDTVRALADFAAWHRRRMDALVIAMTGSVGKTTAREMTYAALSARLAGRRAAGNFNNHIGLPLSLLEVERGHAFVVLELGSSAPGEIRSLADIACPQVGVVTRVGIAHLSGLGSVEAIQQEKGALVEALPQTGLAVLGGDDPLTSELAAKAACRVVTVGTARHNVLVARDVSSVRDRLRFRVDRTVFEVRAAGRHNLTAALAAVAVGREAGLSDAEVARGLASFTPPAGRCQVCATEPFTLIDDSYNANPSSMEAACRLLSSWEPARARVLVVGDMAELGDAAGRWHERLGETAARLNIDRLAALGSHAEDVVRGALSAGMPSNRVAACGDVDHLLGLMDHWIEPGDVVLVKGSRSMRMERVVGPLAAHGRELKENHTPRGDTRACT
jgi:UDP-N-acetylmuramoyl-tripeptide--D-alanyl-D-alanine ligase